MPSTGMRWAEVVPRGKGVAIEGGVKPKAIYLVIGAFLTNVIAA